MIKQISNTLMVITLLIAGCSSPSIAQDDFMPTISINGTGFASVKPDIVDIQLGVDTISAAPGTAVSQNTSRMNAVLKALEALGVSSDDTHTVYYSMWVEDIYDETGQLTGERRYHVSNQINVRLDDLTQTGTVLEEAIDAGATTINGITFGVADTTELEQTALQNAIADANLKAARIAEDIGAEVGAVQVVIQGGSSVPIVPYYGEKIGIGFGGGGAVPISEGQFSMTVQIQIVYELIP